MLAWDKATGKPLSKAIVWQDRRSAAICDRLSGRAGELARITGLPLDPYFAAPKITWLRENVTAGGVVTTTDTWLLHRLGAAYVTDAATASRTMLLDLDAVQWSDQACEAFGVDPGALPRVADCAGVVGETTVFGNTGFGNTGFGNRPLPVAGIAVDQQAALYAHGCLRQGDAKCTYGTGAFLLVTTGEKAARSNAGLSASVAWQLAGAPGYCLDGQVYTAGSALRWLTEIGVLAPPRTSTAWRAPCPTPAASRSCPRWPAWARRSGRRAPGASSPGCSCPPGGGTSRGPSPRGSPPPSRCWPRPPPPTWAAAHLTAGRRRAHPVAGAAAGPGRPAPGAGAGQPHPRRDRARRRRACPPRPRRGRAVAGEVELTVPPVMTRDQAAQRLSRYRRALASTLS